MNREDFTIKVLIICVVGGVLQSLVFPFKNSEINSSYNFIYGKSCAINSTIGSGNILICDSLLMNSVLTDDNWIVDYSLFDEVTAKKIQDFSKVYKGFSRQKRIEKVKEIIKK